MDYRELDLQFNTMQASLAAMVATKDQARAFAQYLKGKESLLSSYNAVSAEIEQLCSSVTLSGLSATIERVRQGIKSLAALDAEVKEFKKQCGKHIAADLEKMLGYYREKMHLGDLEKGRAMLEETRGVLTECQKSLKNRLNHAAEEAKHGRMWRDAQDEVLSLLSRFDDENDIDEDNLAVLEQTVSNAIARRRSVIDEVERKYPMLAEGELAYRHKQILDQNITRSEYTNQLQALVSKIDGIKRKKTWRSIGIALAVAAGIALVIIIIVNIKVILVTLGKILGVIALIGGGFLFLKHKLEN